MADQIHRETIGDLTLRTEDEKAAFLDGYRAAIQECLMICSGERVDAESTGDPSDLAYNMACDHVADRIGSRSR